jgi:hypothetical protein
MQKSGRIGVIGEVVPSALKRELLLFDRLAVLDLENAIRAARWYGRDDNNYYLGIANDLEFLAEKGLVFDAGNPLANGGAVKAIELIGDSAERAKQDGLSLESLKEDFSDWLHFICACGELSQHRRVAESYYKKNENDADKLSRYMKRSFPRLFKRNLAYHQFGSWAVAHKMRVVDKLDASPLITDELVLTDSLKRSKKDYNKQNNTIQIVLNQIPLPDDSVPWEQVLEFRDDGELQGYLSGLRVWIAEFSRQKLNPKEAEEKLEWLIFQQSQYVKNNKASYNLNAVGTLLVTAAEVAEDLVKIRWGKAAKGVATLVSRKAGDLGHEMSGPAKELTYILRAQERFSK